MAKAVDKLVVNLWKHCSVHVGALVYIVKVNYSHVYGLMCYETLACLLNLPLGLLHLNSSLASPPIGHSCLLVRCVAERSPHLCKYIIHPRVVIVVRNESYQIGR